MMNYTEAQKKAIHDYLAECIKNSYRCQHCALNHDGICFFAFECFMNDGKYFKEDDEDIMSDDVDETNYEPYCGCDMFEICGSIDEEW